MFYWNKIIPLKQMEKRIPPEFFGREKRKRKKEIVSVEQFVSVENANH